MTPKEKAIELVDIYKDITTTWIFKDTITANVINYDLAKNCALIAVDEVLKILEHSIPDIQYTGKKYKKKSKNYDTTTL
jgi:hypothetical protein